MPKREAKKRKRANGEGSIYQEKSGRYRVAISVRSNGQTERRTATAWKQAEAVALLQKLKTDQQCGPSSSASVRTKIKTVWHLIDRWMEIKVRPEKRKEKDEFGNYVETLVDRMAKNTVYVWSKSCDKHLRPYFESKPLKGFDVLEAEEFAKHLSTTGVGTSAAIQCWSMCSSAFSYGQTIRLVVDNPFKLAETPRHTSRKMKPFTVEEMQLMIKSTEGSRVHALLVVAFSTGMRQGELFGLQWDRVNLDEGWLFVDQQAVEAGGHTHLTKPKTPQSIRRLNLTPQAINAIKLHRAILMKEGNAGSVFVFPDRRGNVQSRSNWYSSPWKPLLVKLAINHRGAHNTRHTFATLALGENVPVTVVSKMLGHANVVITLKTYAHVIPTHENQAVNTIARLIG